MLKLIRQLTAAAAMTAACTAGAEMQSIDIADIVEQVAPLQARTISMGDYTAVVYYTEMTNGNYNVVTTVGPNSGINGSITQHSIELSPGQHYTFKIDQNSDRDVAFSTNAVNNVAQISSL